MAKDYWLIMIKLTTEMIEYLKGEKEKGGKDKIGSDEWHDELKPILDAYIDMRGACSGKLAENNKRRYALDIIELICIQFKFANTTDGNLCGKWPKIKIYRDFRIWLDKKLAVRKVYRKWYKALRTTRTYAELHYGIEPPKDEESMEFIMNKYLPESDRTNNTPAT